MALQDKPGSHLHCTSLQTSASCTCGVWESLFWAANSLSNSKVTSLPGISMTVSSFGFHGMTTEQVQSLPEAIWRTACRS